MGIYFKVMGKFKKISVKRLDRVRYIIINYYTIGIYGGRKIKRGAEVEARKRGACGGISL